MLQSQSYSNLVIQTKLDGSCIRFPYSFYKISLQSEKNEWMRKRHKLAISNDIAYLITRWLSMIAQRESLFIGVIINFLITSLYLTMHNQRKYGY